MLDRLEVADGVCGGNLGPNPSYVSSGSSGTAWAPVIQAAFHPSIPARSEAGAKQPHELLDCDPEPVTAAGELCLTFQRSLRNPLIGAASLPPASIGSGRSPHRFLSIPAGSRPLYPSAPWDGPPR